MRIILKSCRIGALEAEFWPGQWDFHMGTCPSCHCFLTVGTTFWKFFFLTILLSSGPMATHLKHKGAK